MSTVDLIGRSLIGSHTCVTALSVTLQVACYSLQSATALKHLDAGFRMSLPAQRSATLQVLEHFQTRQCRQYQNCRLPISKTTFKLNSSSKSTLRILLNKKRLQNAGPTDGFH